MVVMVMAQQDGGDGRQVLESHCRLPDAPGSHQVQRARPLRIHGIGQDVPGRRLNQKGRVADERHDRFRAIESGRPL